MCRLLWFLLFPFAVTAMRSSGDAKTMMGTCCCFLPHTGEFREFGYDKADPYWHFDGLHQERCPAQPDTSKKALSPRGCRGRNLYRLHQPDAKGKARGDLPIPCKGEKVPHPDDMFCENYLVFSCGSLTINIPEEWKNCYRNTTDLGHNKIVKLVLTLLLFLACFRFAVPSTAYVTLICAYPGFWSDDLPLGAVCVHEQGSLCFKDPLSVLEAQYPEEQHGAPGECHFAITAKVLMLAGLQRPGSLALQNVRRLLIEWGCFLRGFKARLAGDVRKKLKDQPGDWLEFCRAPALDKKGPRWRMRFEDPNKRLEKSPAVLAERSRVQSSVRSAKAGLGDSLVIDNLEKCSADELKDTASDTSDGPPPWDQQVEVDSMAEVNH
ncbi:hypothetical protein AK812_SmicGene18717 [Symbiodinium microadriaticum]|uniref:Uncharacterized protein n=1 Tax=Symbiodinium microadriaticum TaxID=2951 RepID=A0A1Q9DUG1_SYMMI|nr:hypothetical protein AK812_SmicGene18717 [Symbiodinium microadriaticum]